MEFTLEDLYEGAAIPKSEMIILPRTRDFVEPFVDAVSKYIKDDSVFEIKADMKLVAANVKESNDIEEVAYTKIFNRVWIEAPLKSEYTYISEFGGEQDFVAGLLFALDISEPVIKTFVNYRKRACLNLQIFNPYQINTVNIFKTVDPIKEAVKIIPDYLGKVEQMKKELVEAENFLHNTFSGLTIDTMLGKLAKRAARQNLMSHFNATVQLIQSNRDYNGIKNIYFKGVDAEYTPYELYNCFTASAGVSKDFKDTPQKVLSIYKLFNN